MYETILVIIYKAVERNKFGCLSLAILLSCGMEEYYDDFNPLLGSMYIFIIEGAFERNIKPSILEK